MSKIPISVDARVPWRSVTATVRITHVREMRARVRIAEFLIRLAWLIIGCKMDIIVEEVPDAIT